MITIRGIEYLFQKEVTKKFGVSVSWLEKRRQKQINPKHVRLGDKGRILYPLKQTDEWFKEQLKLDE